MNYIEEELSEMKKYTAIIADPPWRYGSPKALVGNGGRGSLNIEKMKQVDVEAHYETMSLADIKSLPVPAAASSFLFLWVTNPFLCDGSGPDVVKAWGYTPKSVITWAKVQSDGSTPSMKTGHWLRSASEHVILGVRGDVRRSVGFPALPTWFSALRAPHSVKPDKIHDYAELMAPSGPWLEMFARRSRPGWDMWGKEAPTGVMK